MPQAGEVQWKTSNCFITKADISRELNIASNQADWAETAFLALAVNPGSNPTIFGTLITLCAMNAVIYYNTYEDQIYDLLQEVESLEENTEFHVEQKFKWHAGQRGWRPLNNFRVVVD